jgi:hypothetical protein
VQAPEQGVVVDSDMNSRMKYEYAAVERQPPMGTRAAIDL